VLRTNEIDMAVRGGKAPAVCLLIGLALLHPRPAVADAVTDWNVNAAKALRAGCIEPAGSNNPLHESRAYAMMHAAIHDSLNAIDRRSHPYAFDAPLEPAASAEAAAASAARGVLVSAIGEIPPPFSPECLQAGIASAEADYAAALAAVPDGPAKTRGIEIGQASAATINALRAADGSDTILLDFDYPQGTDPGEFRFPPGFDFAFAPEWGNVTPFVLNHGSQFRPGPPHKVSSKKYAADFNEVKIFGGDGIVTPSARTPDQTEAGLFWIEGSVLTWNRIARNVSDDRGLDLWENARLFGLLNLAIADGYIGAGHTKYHYNFWRPVTAIHTAESDGNPDTAGDPAWTPLQANYPTPDYDSAHSVAGGAAAQVLKEFFGTDHIGFDSCSLTLPAGSTCEDASPVVRNYTSFSQAADENALSRIHIGIHFRHAVEEGVKHGRKIGNRAVNVFLRPVR
jgi:hypothetical protein